MLLELLIKFQQLQIIYFSSFFFIYIYIYFILVGVSGWMEKEFNFLWIAHIKSVYPSTKCINNFIDLVLIGIWLCFCMNFEVLLKYYKNAE